MRIEEFKAMGTDIVVVDGNGDASADLFGRAERRFSRFLEGSELSRLNRTTGTSIVVSDEMAVVLGVSRELRKRTSGLVDPAVGGRIIEWGYDRSFEDLGPAGPAPESCDPAVWGISGRLLERSPGTRFDLGGIAKGFTADRVVESGIAGVVSAGGDVRSNRHDTVVEIEDPWGETAIAVRLGVGGLATSSTTRRRWMVEGEPVSHIIDPRTGCPAVSPILSATVLAASAVEAEAGAKAVLLLGEDGLAWAERQPWIAAALAIWHDGCVYATTGWEVAA